MRSTESFAAHVRYNTNIWNKTEAGRDAIRRHNTTRAERNRQAALIKSGGVVLVKPGVFDGGAVQRTLMQWGR